MKTNKLDALLWLDVETTGLDPDEDKLLEVGLVLTTLEGEEIDEYTDVIHPTGSIHVTAENVRAVTMHCANGLLREAFTTDVKTHTTRAVGARILLWIQDKARDYMLHVAGSNPQFDLMFLNKQLELVGSISDYLSHRRLDLSCIRLMLQTLNQNPYDNSHKTTHRVNDCLSRDLTDYRRYLALLRKAVAS